jgi:hypothetical protein
MLFQILAVAFASISAVLLIFSRQVRMLFARLRRAVRGLFGSDEAEGVDVPQTAAEHQDRETD